MVHLLKPKNGHINGLNFVANPKNPIFGVFLGIIPKMRIFSKNPAPSVFHPLDTLTSCKVLEKSYEPLRRNNITD